MKIAINLFSVPKPLYLNPIDLYILTLLRKVIFCKFLSHLISAFYNSIQVFFILTFKIIVALIPFCALNLSFSFYNRLLFFLSHILNLSPFLYWILFFLFLMAILVNSLSYYTNKLNSPLNLRNKTCFASHPSFFMSQKSSCLVKLGITATSTSLNSHNLEKLLTTPLAS